MAAKQERPGEIQHFPRNIDNWPGVKSPANLNTPVRNAISRYTCARLQPRDNCITIYNHRREPKSRIHNKYRKCRGPEPAVTLAPAPHSVPVSPPAQDKRPGSKMAAASGSCREVASLRLLKAGAGKPGEVHLQVISVIIVGFSVIKRGVPTIVTTRDEEVYISLSVFVAPQTVQELADALVQVLEEIPQETIRRLIRSMPRRYREQMGQVSVWSILWGIINYMDNDDSRIRGTLCPSLIGRGNFYDIIVAMATIMTSTSILCPSLNQKLLPLCTTMYAWQNRINAGIRQWNYFSTEELLVYDTMNYRWCENIGRAHRSNNVMLLVDLKREIWYQKCYDPVCRAQNFKSKLFPLPPEVCLPYILKEEEEGSLTWDENGNITEIKQDLLLVEELAVGKSWECCIDDAAIVEAAEDAELVDAADRSLENWSVEETDIPDELLLQAVDAHCTFDKT
ncbi:unnamed protein product [Ranitomeya imitator]|uniref:DNA-directed primase/polymerase protein n=1 Tax=Ranitomeya imitator TaxID=111125 RepID=A0ABN9LI05_9NEOB|nr:unnamed protein product [Ranitomeya imitator]